MHLQSIINIMHMGISIKHCKGICWLKSSHVLQPRLFQGSYKEGVPLVLMAQTVQNGLPKNTNSLHQTPENPGHPMS